VISGDYGDGDELCRVCRVRKIRSRSGAALLLLLLVIVLGIMVYGFTSHRNDLKVEQQEEMSSEDRPWMDESLLVDKDSGKEVERPYPEQAQFTDPIEFVAKVSHGGEHRGKMSLTIQPDGLVAGAWQGKYENAVEKKSYEIMSGGFEGNIVPSMIYIDENGAEDKSKLFFMSKGEFIIIEQLHEHGNRLQHILGHIYVTGWVNPDMSASGKVHLTSDKKSQIVYQWTAFRGQPVKSVF